MSSGQAGEITSPLRAPDFTINIEGSRYVADGGRRYRPIRHPDLGDVWDDIYASAANSVITNCFKDNGDPWNTAR